MIAYLDSSALVKLVKEEAESEALGGELQRWDGWSSSRLARVEVSRAARLATADAEQAVEELMELLALLPLDDAVLTSAAVLEPRSLRSLDAIHLATALSVGDDLGTLITYDERMLAAAQSAGLPATAPR